MKPLSTILLACALCGCGHKAIVKTEQPDRSNEMISFTNSYFINQYASWLSYRGVSSPKGFTFRYVSMRLSDFEDMTNWWEFHLSAERFKDWEADWDSRHPSFAHSGGWGTAHIISHPGSGQDPYAVWWYGRYWELNGAAFGVRVWSTNNMGSFLNAGNIIIQIQGVVECRTNPDGIISIFARPATNASNAFPL